MKSYMTAADRQALIDEVATYRRETGMSETAICAAALGDRHYVYRLRIRRGNMGWPNAVKLRAFMAANPKGVNDVVVPTHHATVMAGIARRREETERRDQERARRAALLDQAERAAPVASVLLETPSDLMRMVQRRAPALMGRVIEVARDAGEMPGDLILSMIEQGLEARGAA